MSLDIIIPTFNSSQTINNCLSSILSQTYKNINIIIIDGYSADNTIEIINKYALINENVKWISESDSGIYDAMNKGIAMATHDWIYFLGSDDCLKDTHVLEDVFNVLNNTQSDLVYGNAVMLSNNSLQGGEFDLYKLWTQNNICHQVIFYRREVFSKIGKYNIRYPIVADWDFNIRCFSNENVKTEFINREIVLFNDVSGISNNSRNDPFYKLIPAPYAWDLYKSTQELDKIKQENNGIKCSNEFKIGKYIYDFFKKIGLIYLLKKIH